MSGTVNLQEQHTVEKECLPNSVGRREQNLILKFFDLAFALSTWILALAIDFVVFASLSVKLYTIIQKGW